jgi:hypothetical protein
MDAYCLKFETLVCTALAGVTVTTIGILLNAMFSAGFVA